MSRATAARTPLVAQVFQALADRQFHSGEELAEALEVSRSAIWKAVRQLEDLGAGLHAVRNRGYRLARGGAPLAAAQIREALPREVRAVVTRIDTAWSVDSTNTVLLARPNVQPGTSEVQLAEYQRAGRGRRGRAWLAPLGGAICLSLSWTFAAVPEDLGGLGLAIGVCALRALRGLGVAAAALKWPNDLLLADQKLGGVLIELRAESAGPACVVIGIGLNVALGEAQLAEIRRTGTAATDLASAGAAPLGRNAIAAALIAECVRGLATFASDGLKPFLSEWRAADALQGRPVKVTGAEGDSRGLARGIDLHGALLVETPQGLKRFLSGDVSVRPG
jgi:BirA family transcriptional regulator, biotin operon repressor / biotin---[acetyl-CoA-carboxylase] ligase